MENYQPSNTTSSKKSNDLAFVPYTLSGATGVMLGWLIAGYVGII